MPDQSQIYQFAEDEEYMDSIFELLAYRKARLEDIGDNDEYYF